MASPTVKLNNGYEMPALGTGTYGIAEEDVKYAIDAGYRHFDTAFLYRTELQVGAAIKCKIAEGVVKREDLFIVTKLWNAHHDPDKVEPACRLSLKTLGLDYIDLYLMHTPLGFNFKGYEDVDFRTVYTDKNTFSDVDYVDTYKAMEKLVDAGLVRSLGVSNFNSEQINRILSECKIKPVTNQVECNPSINQKRLIKFCKERDIVVTAYCPLRSLSKPDEPDTQQLAISDSKVKAIGDKYSKTPGQVILRYLIQLGTVPIPRSTNKERIQQNIDVFDFNLSEDEMKTMDTFNTGKRIIDIKVWCHHKYFPFNIEF